MELDLAATILLVVAAFVAGAIDSIAGGGGLVTLPALLVAGVDPLATLGTNKVQAIFGSGSASVAYVRGGLVDLRSVAPLAAVSASASAIGAIVANIIPTDALELMIPIALVAIALFFAVKPAVDDLDRTPRIGAVLFGLSVVPAVGFYDGVFGPGTGSFFMIGYVGLAGLGVLRATGHTKLLNFASNLGALVVFAIGGSVLWRVGLLMGIAQVGGATLGSRIAMANGARVIKPLLVTTCVAMAARLLVFD